MKYYGGYVKVVIINLIITLYMFCILKMIYFITTKQTDYFPWTDDETKEMKEKIDLFNKVKECLDKTDMNKKIVNILKKYRLIEETIFFFSIISLILYGILCKIFILAKRLLTSQEMLAQMQDDDPFWAILTKSVSDFYSIKNHIMTSLTL